MTNKNTFPDDMENILDEEGLSEGIGRKFNEDISGEGVIHEKININDADEDDLLRISGLKKEMVEKILNYREKVGGFKDIDDLDKLDLDRNMIKRLKNWVRV